MLLMNKIVGLITLVLLCSCEQPTGYVVSIVELMTSPDRYIGKSIEVTGYLPDPEQSGHALFLSKEHAELGDSSSSVWLSDFYTSDGVGLYESCMGRFVTVQGFFGKYADQPAFLKITRVFHKPIDGTFSACWSSDEA